MAIERIPLNEAARHDLEAGGEPRIADARIESGEEDLDRSLRPQAPRRLRQPASGDRPARGLHRGRAAPRRAARPRPARRAPGLGKTSLAHIIAAELEVPLVADGGPGARAQGRRRQLPDDARARHRLLRRRDPPPQPGDRGDALPGDGGPQAARRPRPGRRRPHRHARSARLHARRRDHPSGPADARRCATASASPIASSTTSRATWRRSSSARRGSSGSRSSPPARRRSRPARAARRASPTGCSSGSGTSPRSTGRA